MGWVCLFPGLHSLIVPSPLAAGSLRAEPPGGTGGCQVLLATKDDEGQPWCSSAQREQLSGPRDWMVTDTSQGAMGKDRELSRTQRGPLGSAL